MDQESEFDRPWVPQVWKKPFMLVTGSCAQWQEPMSEKGISEDGVGGVDGGGELEGGWWIEKVLITVIGSGSFGGMKSRVTI